MSPPKKKKTPKGDNKPANQQTNNYVCAWNSARPRLFCMRKRCRSTGSDAVTWPSVFFFFFFFFPTRNTDWPCPSWGSRWMATRNSKSHNEAFFSFLSLFFLFFPTGVVSFFFCQVSAARGDILTSILPVKGIGGMLQTPASFSSVSEEVMSWEKTVGIILFVANT